MDMPGTTTNATGKPAGLLSAGKAAPAGETTPEGIRAGMHLNGNEGAQLDKIVLAGRKVMFSEQSHQMFLDQVDAPGDMAQKLGKGVAGLMALLWQESRQSIPPKLLIPAGMVLVGVAAEFLNKGGMEVTDKDIAGGMEEMVDSIMTAAGVDTGRMSEMGGRSAGDAGKMAQPDSGEL